MISGGGRVLAKQVVLRKSERRQLREQAEQLLLSSSWSSQSKPPSKPPMQQLQLQQAQRNLLTVAFLQGTLSSRTLSWPRDAFEIVSVTLYWRSRTTTATTATTTAATATASNEMTVWWPCTRADQCLWITIVKRATPHSHHTTHVPALALLAVWFHVTARHCRSRTTVSSSSLSSLSSCPFGNLPLVIIPPDVSRPLCRGARLMRAGMIRIHRGSSQRPWSSSSSTSTSSNVVVVAVCIQGNPQPCAVGWLHPELAAWYHTTTTTIQQQQQQKHPPRPFGPGTKGVGVEIITAYGDDVWKQQYQEMQSNDPGWPSPGPGPPGLLLDDGHYGNAGFQHGQYVVPLTSRSEPGSSSSFSSSTPNMRRTLGQTAIETGATTINHDHDNHGNDNGCTQKEDAGSVSKEEEEEEDDGGGDGTANNNGPSSTPLVPMDSDGPADQERNEPDRKTDQGHDGNGDAGNDNNNNNKTDTDTVAEQQPTVSPDQVLHQAVCKALSQLYTKRENLPMKVARFYAEFVLPNRPSGTTVELKQTRYKKLSVYLAEQMELGLVTLGPADKPSTAVAATKGKKNNNNLKNANNNNNNNNNNSSDPLAMLLDYNKHHPDVRAYIQQAEEDPAAASLSSGATKRLVVVNLFLIPHHFTKFLRLDPDAVKAVNASSDERKNTGMLTLQEMREILDEYIRREELVDPQRPSMIQLDGPLTDALFKSKAQNAAPLPQSLSRKDLTTAWQAKMEPAFAIVQVPGNTIVQMGRGKAPKVLIEVIKRQQKKFVTRLRGLEEYGVNAIAFSKQVTQRFACSATVLNSSEALADGRPALKKGHCELVFQGNWVDELEALLVGDETLSSHGGAKGSPYQLPKNAMEVILRKGVPARKNKPGTTAAKKK